jgi:O-antigen/teichoic acid export membrane protein
VAGKLVSPADELGSSVIASDTYGASSTKKVDPVLPTRPNRRDSGWDIRYGPSNYLVLVGAQAASALLSFAAVWIATRYLGPSGYGSVVAILAASQLMMQLALNWTAVSLSRYGCEEFVETGLVARAFWSRLLILIVNLVIVVATFPLWGPLVSDWLHIPSQAQPLILVYLLAASCWLHVQQTLQAAKLQRSQGVLLAVERGIVLLLLVALALIERATLVSLVLAYICGSAGACLIGLWRLRSLIYPVVSLNRLFLKRMLTFSLPLIPSSLIGYFSTNYLDAWFIVRYLSLAELGVYSVAYQLIGMSMQLPLLAGSLLMPLFITLQVGGRDDRVDRFMREVLPLLTLLWSMCCALVAVIGSYILPGFFGPQFLATADLLWPLMAASALACPVLIGYGPLASTIGATYVAAAGAGVAACVNVILNILLIPRFGLSGCAWATAGAYGTSMVAIALLMHRRAPLNRTWILQATLPALFGAGYKAWHGGNLGALAVAFLTTALLTLLHRRSIAAGFVTLHNQQRLRSSARTVVVS